MTEKTKKRLTIAGVSVLGLALLVAIGMQFAKTPDKPDTLPQTEQGSSSVTSEVQPPEVVVTPPNNTPSQPVETLPPQTDLPEQKLQTDPVKPEPPENPKAADGTDRTPSSDEDHDFTPESPDAPPAYKPEDTEKKPTPSPESKPQGGEVKDGKIYVPGFGWIDDVGEGQGSTADDMYENGNKIGDMD
jgi:hypothetical protein